MEVACFDEAEKMVTSIYLGGMGVTGPEETQMPPLAKEKSAPFQFKTVQPYENFFKIKSTELVTGVVILKAILRSF